MSRDDFQRYKQGDRGSAADFNKLRDRVAKLESGQFRDGIFIGGIHATRQSAGGGGGAAVILVQAQEDAQADMEVSCKRYDTTAEAAYGEAFDVTGLAANAASLTKLNEGAPRIVTDDILPAFKKGSTWYFACIFGWVDDCDCYTAP